MDDVVTRGIAEPGKIDILIADAGIWTMAPFLGELRALTEPYEAGRRAAIKGPYSRGRTVG